LRSGQHNDESFKPIVWGHGYDFRHFEIGKTLQMEKDSADCGGSRKAGKPSVG
jgi:hypothetical protein